jgi:antitoxin MazE
MQTSLRKIGNSRGILIPADILSVCEISDAVEMHVENSRIIIDHIAPQHRQSWFDNVKAESDADVLADLKDTAIEQG